MGRGVKEEGPLLTFFLGFAFFGFVSSSAISDAASSLASCAGSANSYFGCFGLTRSSTLPMHAHALYSFVSCTAAVRCKEGEGGVLV